MHHDTELPEYVAVLHLLTVSTLWPRTARFVEDGDFDWTGLLDEARTMSGGESLLVRIAYELWHARKDVGLWELPRRLDARHFARVIEALQICRESPADVSPLRLAV